MGSHRLALLGILTLLPGGILHAQQLIVSDSAARDILAEARTLRCAFDSGVGFEYGTKTRPNTIPLLRPRPLKRGEYDNPDVIDQIDRQRGTARIVLAAGAVTVAVLSAPPPPRNLRHAGLLGPEGSSVSFLWLAVNNPVLITVYPNRAPGSMTELVAVITRHMEWFGGLSISQYYGRCKVLFS
jgi:hypothetical protein